MTCARSGQNRFFNLSRFQSHPVFGHYAINRYNWSGATASAWLTHPKKRNGDLADAGSGHRPRLLRDHPFEPVCLRERQHAQPGGEHEAMPEGRAQDVALLTHQAHGRHAHGDVLRRDHFSGHGA